MKQGNLNAPQRDNNPPVPPTELMWSLDGSQTKGHVRRTVCDFRRFNGRLFVQQHRNGKAVRMWTPWWGLEKVLAWWITVVLVEEKTKKKSEKRQIIVWRGRVTWGWHGMRKESAERWMGGEPWLHQSYTVGQCVHVKVCLINVHPTQNTSHTQKKEQRLWDRH